MPFKSEKQRRWMHANDPKMAKKWEKEEKKMKKETKVRRLIRKMVGEIMAEMNEGFAGGLKKEDRKAFDKMRRKQSEVLGYTLTGKDDLRAEIDDATIHEKPKPLKETKERNYKEEYKKYGSSKKAKKYRAELNAYNRKKGTYGNGDGKDASHKGGKIAGFEKESVNRGRAEKSRLKKEGFNLNKRYIDDVRVQLKKVKKLSPKEIKAFQDTLIKKLNKNQLKVLSKAKVNHLSQLASQALGEGKLTEGGPGDGMKQKHKDFFLMHIKKDIESIKGQIAYAKDKVNYRGTPDWEKKEFTKVLKDLQKELKEMITRQKKVSKWRVSEGKLKESGILYKAGVKKYGKEGMDKILSAAGKKKSHAEIGAIKDKYEKDKKEGVVTEKKETAIDVARRIVKNKQYEKYKGVMLDGYTANAIMKVYDAVNDSMKAKLEKLPLNKLVSIVWKVMKK